MSFLSEEDYFKVTNDYFAGKISYEDYINSFGNEGSKYVKRY